MSRQLRGLDLFSGAGGATRGYQLAGFRMTGVDIRPQPRYVGEEFIMADALEYVHEHGHEYDFIHASPPCQAFTPARHIHGSRHPDLLSPTRELLLETGRPWVIENVPGAPMRPDLVLCGSHFGLRCRHGRLVRHRLFEFDTPRLLLVPPCDHSGPVVSVFGHGGHVYHGVGCWREVMQIPWMTREELSQAIPPAYTHFIGVRLRGEMEGLVYEEAE
ncbi:hypothetical protein [Rubrobacter calidifluminis]|uniref:hypothetical protein n=1 Tax=Rubrobacter calidifluminis TaxID=1392640 RepID=UPI00236118EC|nr:hypothetical protein [Rubrobacter calidifluminis]